MNGRKSAVDPAAFISCVVQYAEGVGAYSEWGTSAAIKRRKETKTTFLIKKETDISPSTVAWNLGEHS